MWTVCTHAPPSLMHPVSAVLSPLHSSDALVPVCAAVACFRVDTSNTSCTFTALAAVAAVWRMLLCAAVPRCKQTGLDCAETANTGLVFAMFLSCAAVCCCAQVQANWVVNVLTPWQHGIYAAGCWPFQASMGAVVDLAPILTPDDSPRLQINGAVCPEAAAAAALAAELGYVGPQQAMQQRYDAMDAHLAWILHELGLQQL